MCSFYWFISYYKKDVLKKLSQSNFKKASLFMFYTPFFDLIWLVFYASLPPFLIPNYHFLLFIYHLAQRMWCLIFHTDSTENTDKNALCGVLEWEK